MPLIPDHYKQAPQLTLSRQDERPLLWGGLEAHCFLRCWVAESVSLNYLVFSSAPLPAYFQAINYSFPKPFPETIRFA
ncbi:MAG: hypothetical protein Kow00121_50540 [Elainellaceae cyanobacterium]